MQTSASLILERQRESLWLLFGPVSRNTSSLSPARSRTVSESQQLKRKSTRWRDGGQTNALPFFDFPPFFFFFWIFFACPFSFDRRWLATNCHEDAQARRYIVSRVTPTSYNREFGVQLNSRSNYIFRARRCVYLIHFPVLWRIFRNLIILLENVCVCVCVYISEHPSINNKHKRRQSQFDKEQNNFFHRNHVRR